MKRFSKRSILLATGSAMIGGLGVGVVAVGTMANADSRPAQVTVVGDSGATGDSGIIDVPGTPNQNNDPAGRPDRRAHLAEVLAPLVTDGTITQAQADKVIDAIDKAAPDHDGRGGGKRAELVASTIGITVEQLRTELGTDKSVADVAKAHGVDVQKVIDALVADATAHIDQAVTDGHLTAAQAATEKATLVDRITKRVNTAGFPGRGPDGPGGRGGRGGHGPHGDFGGDHDGDGPGAPTDAASSGASA